MEKAVYTQSPLLGGLEVLNASFEKQHFSRHTHEGYTIGLIRRGAQRFWRSGARHTAPSNSVILVNADQVHDGHSATDTGWSYEAIYPTPEQLASISQELGNNALPHFPMAVSHDARLARLLSHLFHALKSPEPLLQETVLHATLLTLSSQFSQQRRQPRQVKTHQSGILRAKTLLDDTPEAQVSLDMLATIAGLSRYHFSRQFKQLTGLPAHAYQVQRRLQLAKTLLAQGHSIVDVATASGFHDQSHLHRHFRRALGITPRAYQKTILM
jgi:AraC-like DNA-binding protein